MNVREALEGQAATVLGAEVIQAMETQSFLSVEYIAPIIERAARAAWNKGLADQHRFPVSSDNGVSAFVAAMVEGE